MTSAFLAHGLERVLEELVARVRPRAPTRRRFSVLLGVQHLDDLVRRRVLGRDRCEAVGVEEGVREIRRIIRLYALLHELVEVAVLERGLQDVLRVRRLQR